MDLFVQQVILERIGKEIPVRLAGMDPGPDLDPVPTVELPAIAAAGDADIQRSPDAPVLPGQGIRPQQQYGGIVADLREGQQRAGYGEIAAGRKTDVPIVFISVFPRK